MPATTDRWANRCGEHTDYCPHVTTITPAPIHAVAGQRWRTSVDDTLRTHPRHSAFSLARAPDVIHIGPTGICCGQFHDTHELMRCHTEVHFDTDTDGLIGSRSRIQIAAARAIEEQRR